MNSDGVVILALIVVSCLLLYFLFSSMFSDLEKYRQLCAKHNLEYVDWNNNAISCFDPETNEVKAFKNES